MLLALDLDRQLDRRTLLLVDQDLDPSTEETPTGQDMTEVKTELTITPQLAFTAWLAGLQLSIASMLLGQDRTDDR